MATHKDKAEQEFIKALEKALEKQTGKLVPLTRNLITTACQAFQAVDTEISIRALETQEVSTLKTKLRKVLLLCGRKADVESRSQSHRTVNLQFVNSARQVLLIFLKQRERQPRVESYPVEDTWGRPSYSEAGGAGGGGAGGGGGSTSRKPTSARRTTPSPIFSELRRCVERMASFDEPLPTARERTKQKYARQLYNWLFLASKDPDINRLLSWKRCRAPEKKALRGFWLFSFKCMSAFLEVGCSHEKLTKRFAFLHVCQPSAFLSLAEGHKDIQQLYDLVMTTGSSTRSLWRPMLDAHAVERYLLSPGFASEASEPLAIMVVEMFLRSRKASETRVSVRRSYGGFLKFANVRGPGIRAYCKAWLRYPTRNFRPSGLEFYHGFLKDLPDEPEQDQLALLSEALLVAPSLFVSDDMRGLSQDERSEISQKIRRVVLSLITYWQGQARRESRAEEKVLHAVFHRLSLLSVPYQTLPELLCADGVPESCRRLFNDPFLRTYLDGLSVLRRLSQLFASYQTLPELLCADGMPESCRRLFNDPSLRTHLDVLSVLRSSYADCLFRLIEFWLRAQVDGASDDTKDWLQGLPLHSPHLRTYCQAWLRAPKKGLGPTGLQFNHGFLKPLGSLFAQGQLALLSRALDVEPDLLWFDSVESHYDVRGNDALERVQRALLSLFGFWKTQGAGEGDDGEALQGALDRLVHLRTPYQGFRDMVLCEKTDAPRRWHAVFDDDFMLAYLGAHDGRLEGDQGLTSVLIELWLRVTTEGSREPVYHMLQNLPEGSPLIRAYCEAWLRTPREALRPSWNQFYHGFLGTTGGEVDAAALASLSRALSVQPNLLRVTNFESMEADDQSAMLAGLQCTALSLFQLWKAEGLEGEEGGPQQVVDAALGRLSSMGTPYQGLRGMVLSDDAEAVRRWRGAFGDASMLAYLRAYGDRLDRLEQSSVLIELWLRTATEDSDSTIKAFLQGLPGGHPLCCVHFQAWLRVPKAGLGPTGLQFYHSFLKDEPYELGPDQLALLSDALDAHPDLFVVEDPDSLSEGDQAVVFKKAQCTAVSLFEFWKTEGVREGSGEVLGRALSRLVRLRTPYHGFRDMVLCERTDAPRRWSAVLNNRCMFISLDAQDGRSANAQLLVATLIELWLKTTTEGADGRVTRFLHHLPKSHPLLHVYCEAWLREPKLGLGPSAIQFCHGFLKDEHEELDHDQLALLSRALDVRPSLLLVGALDDLAPAEQSVVLRRIQHTILSLFQFWQEQARAGGKEGYDVVQAALDRLSRLRCQYTGLQTLLFCEQTDAPMRWKQVFDDGCVLTCLAAQDGESSSSQRLATTVIEFWLRTTTGDPDPGVKGFLESLREGSPLLHAYCEAWLRVPKAGLGPTGLQFYHGLLKAVPRGELDHDQLALLSRALDVQPNLLLVSSVEDLDEVEQTAIAECDECMALSLFQFWQQEAAAERGRGYASLGGALGRLSRLQFQKLDVARNFHAFGQASRALLPMCLRESDSLLPGTACDAEVEEGQAMTEATELLRFLRAMESELAAHDGAEPRPLGGLENVPEALDAWLTGAGLSQRGQWFLWRACQVDGAPLSGTARMINTRFSGTLAQHYANLDNLEALCDAVRERVVRARGRDATGSVATLVGACKEALSALLGEDVLPPHQVVDAVLWLRCCQRLEDPNSMEPTDMAALWHVWDQRQTSHGPTVSSVDPRQVEAIFLDFSPEVLTSLLVSRWLLPGSSGSDEASMLAFERFLERRKLLGPQLLISLLEVSQPLKAWCVAHQYDLTPNPACRERVRCEIQGSKSLTSRQQRLACSKLGVSQPSVKHRLKNFAHLAMWLITVVAPFFLAVNYANSLPSWTVFHTNVGLVGLMVGFTLLSLLSIVVFLHRRSCDERVVNRWLMSQRCSYSKERLGTAQGFHGACIEHLPSVRSGTPATPSVCPVASPVPPQSGGRRPLGPRPAHRHGGV